MTQRGRRPQASAGADRVRVEAARLLDRWQRGHAHVDSLVESADSALQKQEPAWTYVERRRWREFVYGVARLHGRYDYIIGIHAKRKIAPEVRAALWIALHELIELEAAEHAVVDQANRVVVALGAKHARGFANAVLRSVLRVGVGEGFADPAEDPLSYASEWWSMPRWLVDRWAEVIGPAETVELCAAQNRRPAVHLRSAPGKRAQLKAELETFNWETTELESSPDGLELITRVPPALLLEQVTGACVVQDAAAQLVAPLVAESKPKLVLDMCAAPGGKASHLGQLLEDATILAADLSARRLQRLRPTLERLGLSKRVPLVSADAKAFASTNARFDAVLLDAPCTGTGVLARRHDARWVREPEDLVRLGQLQLELLHRACDLVRPGGVVVYATCSLEYEENDQVVDKLLAEREDVEEIAVGDTVAERYRVDGRLRTWPHRDGIDGAFAARLRRKLEV